MTTEVFSACSWLVGIFEEQSSGRIVGARREFPDSESLCFLEQGEVIKDASTYTAWAVSHIGELLTQCWTREEDQAARNWISFTCSACCVCAMSRTSLKSLIRKINLDDHYSRVTWGASKIAPVRLSQTPKVLLLTRPIRSIFPMRYPNSLARSRIWWKEYNICEMRVIFSCRDYVCTLYLCCRLSNANHCVSLHARTDSLTSSGRHVV